MISYNFLQSFYSNEMDLQSALVCVLVFVVSAAILLLISLFGIREKSYEEALAEQRQLTGSLLGTNQRIKAKEKKLKKAGKKVKEKPTESKTVENVNSATKVTRNSLPARSVSPPKLHVEFEEPIVANPAVKLSNMKKRNKKEKVKPILLNKEKSPISGIDSSKVAVVNHFERIHPKDEFELLHFQKDDIVAKQEKHEIETKPTKVKPTKHVEKKNSEQQKPSKGGNKEKKQPQQNPQHQQQTIKETPKVEPQIVKSTPTVQAANHLGNSVKEKKKKKSEFNTLQQMAASDKHDVNVSLLVPLVRKADLSRSEIQILIDLLLNKQHEAPAKVDEWSEGRSDPVQKLKRQLADKERALTEEQEALASAQAKLREIRAELNSERSRLLQNCRNLEENLHAKHTELQTAAARVHTQNQKLQQMQAQINEEIITSHKLREELNSMQMQRQQLDIHLNQKQEAEASLQTQISQLRNELQEQQNLNSQLNMELMNVRENSHAEKEMLHERLRHLDSQAVLYKNESDQRQELARQLEESRRVYSELEHRFHRTETELTMRYQQQCEETLRYEADQAKVLEDSGKLQTEIVRLNHLHKQQQDDHRRIVNELQTQVSSLQSENNHLQAANGAASEDKNKEIEILNLQNELASLRVHLQQREKQLTTELEEMKKLTRDSQTELKFQREKNDDLRKKNWKMMEALNTTEAKLRKNNDSENLKKLKMEEEDKMQKFLLHLFPNIKLCKTDNWLEKAELAIKKHLEELQQQQETDSSVDVARLQGQVIHYRNIIEDTETILNNLQSHVEREETNWRQQIKAKNEEIQTLKELNRQQQPKDEKTISKSPDDHGVRFAFNCIERSLPVITKELQVKISDLEEKLQSEQQAKEELEKECKVLKDRLNSVETATLSKHTQFGNGKNFNLAEMEQLLEEKTRLTEQLVNEQKKTQELNEKISVLKSNESVSVPVKLLQNHTSNGTSLESTELPNSATSSTVSPTTNKPRNKKKRRLQLPTNN